MKNKDFIRGLWPVMLTPFRYSNEVDYKALEQLTEFYMYSGASGLFANCLSGEMFQLTNQERLGVITAVVKTAEQHNTGVVASGTFSNDVQVCADFIKEVYDTGVKAVIIISNQLVKYEEDEDVLKCNLEKLITVTNDIPLGIYECPYPYKRLISPALMHWLAQTGRFFYHKDTSCNPCSIQKKLAVIEKSNLKLYNANTATSLSSLAMGANGLSAIGANFYPELYSYLTSHFQQEGNSERLQKLNDKLNLMDAIASKCYPYSAKLFLQFRKLEISEQCRIQYADMHEEDYLNLKSLATIYRQVKDELGIDAGFEYSPS